MIRFATRSRRFGALGLAIGLSLGVSTVVLPLAHGQQTLTAEEEALRRRERAAQLVGEALSAWPAAYPYFRPRPPLAGGPLQRPQPWEVLGSPFVAVLPLREVQFMGVQPSTIDRCYGQLERHYTTPLVFRSNLGEAAPYLAAGYGEPVLRAWANYLGYPMPELRDQPAYPELVVETVRGWLAAGGYLVDDAVPNPALPPPARPVERYVAALPVC